MRWPLHRTAIDRPSIRHRLPGWRLDNQRRHFIDPGEGADEATAAPRPGTDGTASNRTVNKAGEVATEKTEERRSGIVWEDEERRLSAARAGGVRRNEQQATRERGGRRRTQ